MQGQRGTPAEKMSDKEASEFRVALMNATDEFPLRYSEVNWNPEIQRRIERGAHFSYRAAASFSEGKFDDAALHFDSAVGHTLKAGLMAVLERRDAEALRLATETNAFRALAVCMRAKSSEDPTLRDAAVLVSKSLMSSASERSPIVQLAKKTTVSLSGLDRMDVSSQPLVSPSPPSSPSSHAGSSSGQPQLGELSQSRPPSTPTVEMSPKEVNEFLKALTGATQEFRSRYRNLNLGIQSEIERAAESSDRAAAPFSEGKLGDAARHFDSAARDTRIAADAAKEEGHAIAGRLRADAKGFGSLAASMHAKSTGDPALQKNFVNDAATLVLRSFSSVFEPSSIVQLAEKTATSLCVSDRKDVSPRSPVSPSLPSSPFSHTGSSAGQPQPGEFPRARTLSPHSGRGGMTR